MQSYANLKITLQLNCIAKHIQFCVQSFLNKTLQKVSNKIELSHFKPVNRHAKIFATVYINQFLNWFNWLAEISLYLVEISLYQQTIKMTHCKREI